MTRDALPRPGTAQFGDGRYDVAVIGGGINGTATAMQLSARGYKVLLVERGDFGSGSSSRSSRFLHCGLYYLAAALESPTLAGKVRNVLFAREMKREQARLFRLLPGGLTPKTFVMPIRAGDRVRPWQYDLAFALLACLGGYGVSLGYRRYAGEALRAHPAAAFFGPDLEGLVSFRELIFDWPERICVDYALEAASNGATVANYTTFRGAVRRQDRWAIELEDSLDPGRRTTVEARAMINLSGIWSDGTNERVDDATGTASAHRRTVTPNKGCHIAVRLPEALRDFGVITTNAIGHLFLCVPWRGYHILGPTETVVERGTETVAVLDADIDSILAEAGTAIPGAGVTRRDVLHRWGGLRPASFDGDNPRGVWKRRFYDHGGRDGPPWMSMSWGRLADHRLTAEAFAARIAGRLGPPRGGAPVGTGREAGSRMPGNAADLDRIVAAEAPATVADVMFGRTGWGWDADLGLSKAAQVADALARHSGTGAEAYLAEYETTIRKTFF